jgi:hypothetical protein
MRTYSLLLHDFSFYTGFTQAQPAKLSIAFKQFAYKYDLPQVIGVVVSHKQ